MEANLFPWGVLWRALYTLRRPPIATARSLFDLNSSNLAGLASDMSTSLISFKHGEGNDVAGEALGGGAQEYGSGVGRDGVAKMKGILRFAPKPKDDEFAGVDGFISSCDPAE